MTFHSTKFLGRMESHTTHLDRDTKHMWREKGETRDVERGLRGGQGEGRGCGDTRHRVTCSFVARVSTPCYISNLKNV